MKPITFCFTVIWVHLSILPFLTGKRCNFSIIFALCVLNHHNSNPWSLIWISTWGYQFSFSPLWIPDFLGLCSPRGSLSKYCEMNTKEIWIIYHLSNLIIIILLRSALLFDVPVWKKIYAISVKYRDFYIEAVELSRLKTQTHRFHHQDYVTFTWINEIDRKINELS